MNMQLSKTPIGLDGIPAAETVLSHVDGERGELIIAGERVGDLAPQDRLRGRDRPAVERRNRPADRRSRGARRLSARRANAPLPGCRICSASPAAYRSSTASAPPSPGCGPKPDCAHEATIVGAFPVIAGALVQRAQGQRSDRARSNRQAMPPTRCR